MGEPFYLGHNNGNSTTLGVLRCNGVEVGRVIYPSVQVEGNSAKLERQKEASFGVNGPASTRYTPFDTKEMVLGFAGLDTFQGYLGFNDRSATTRRGDYTRYWSTANLRALLNTLGVLLPGDVTEAEVFVVAHLPVGAYNAENRRKVIEMLNGTHTFEHRYGQRTRSLRVTVWVTKVIMEGAGALLAYGLPGVQVQQAVLEGGGFTHDGYAAIGQRADLERCGSLEIGVENIGDLLNDFIAKEYNGHKFSAQESHQILLASTSSIQPGPDGRRYPKVYVDGQLFEDSVLDVNVRRARAALAQKIVPYFSTLWRSDGQGGVARNFGRVVYVGGAPYHFQQQLKQLIPGLMVPDQPEYADTDGAARGAETIGEQRKAAKV